MIYKKYSTLIFGCGNVIMGDDGYGPAVVDELNCSYDLPDGTLAVDAGTCVREYLFDFLLVEEDRPERIIIVDAVDYPDCKPGEIVFITSDTIPAKKIHDFSLHQFPTVNLLQELEQHSGINVLIIGAQVESVPDEIRQGLSPAMSAAVGRTCEKIVSILRGNPDPENGGQSRRDGHRISTG